MNRPINYFNEAITVKAEVEQRTPLPAPFEKQGLCALERECRAGPVQVKSDTVTAGALHDAMGGL